MHPTTTTDEGTEIGLRLTYATSTATSTDPSLAGCGSIWCATVTAGHHDDGSDYANDYYGYVAPGAGTIDRTAFTYDGLAYTVTVVGRREGGGADAQYVIGIDPAPPFDFVLAGRGRRPDVAKHGGVDRHGDHDGRHVRGGPSTRGRAGRARPGTPATRSMSV